jgi:uncharacterized protein (DUF58 family)
MTALAALARYDGLALHVRRGMGDRPGERRFPGHPQAAGIELESYALYAPGDDLRHLDWNAVGRLDAFLVRRFTAEREVVFHLLLDASGSMGAPPGDRKLAAGVELTLALAYVALAGGDAVRLTVLDGAEPRSSATLRHRARLHEVAALLDGVRPGGALELGPALERYARCHPHPAAAFVISDLMSEPPALEKGLTALRARRYELALLQVLGRSELEPERLFRQGVLADAESGATHPVRLTRALRERYRALLDEHLGALSSLAARTQALYARFASDTPVNAFVTGELARLGLVRRR